MKHLILLAFISCGFFFDAGISAQTGQLDASYGAGGTVALPDPDLDAYASARIAMHNLSDIVAAGVNNLQKVFAYRLPLLLNGDIDPNFGNNGLAVWPEQYPGNADIYLALAAPDNKTLVVVNEYDYSGPDFDRTRLYMFDLKGNPELTFGDQGALMLDLAPGINEEYLYKGVAMPDGKILLCGLVYDDDLPQGIIIRLNPDGSFDETFNGTGRYILPENLGFSAFATLALTPNGQIMLGGLILNASMDGGTPILFKLNADGTPDTQFGDNGLLLMEFAEDLLYYVGDIIYFPNGQMMVLGVDIDQLAVTVMSLKTDGSLNTSAFGGMGFAPIPVPNDGEIYDLPRFAHSDYARVFVMFGYGFFDESIFEFKEGYLLTAINLGLFPDPGFGDNGFVSNLEFGIGQDIAVDQTGAIYVCSRDANESLIHVSRYKGYPTISTRAPALLSELAITPNPAGEHIGLRLSLPQAESLQIALIGPDGRLCEVLAPFNPYAEGEHRPQFTLSKRYAPGVYRIAVSATDGRTVTAALNIVR